MLENWGKRAGAWFTSAVDNVIAGWETLKTIANELSEKWKAGGTGIGNVIQTAITGGIEFLLLSFMRVMGASANIWMAIGKIIGAALLETVLQIPGMGFAADKMASDKIAAMSPEERAKVAKKYGTYDSSKKSIDVYAMTHPAVAREIAASGMGGNLMKAVGDLKTTLPDLVKGFGDDAADMRAKIDEELKKMGVAGMDETFNKNLANRRFMRAVNASPWLTELRGQMSGAIAMRGTPGALVGSLEEQAGYARKYPSAEYGPARSMAKGNVIRPISMNGVTINVFANEPQEFMDGLGAWITRQPMVAAAGAF
jgi:hypothetical protein